jgi:hypothetical protein
MSPLPTGRENQSRDINRLLLSDACDLSPEGNAIAKGE